MSSFFIKAGYDGWRKQIVNINLLKNNCWKEGLVTIHLNNGNKLRFNNSMNLNPCVNNKLEIIDYNYNYVLMINSMIVYDSPNLFTYHINLLFDSKMNNYTNENIYNYIKYEQLDLSNISTFNNLRTLN